MKCFDDYDADEDDIKVDEYSLDDKADDAYEWYIQREYDVKIMGFGEEL